MLTCGRVHAQLGGTQGGYKGQAVAGHGQGQGVRDGQAAHVAQARRAQKGPGKGWTLGETKMNPAERHGQEERPGDVTSRLARACCGTRQHPARPAGTELVRRSVCHFRLLLLLRLLSLPRAKHKSAARRRPCKVEHRGLPRLQRAASRWRAAAGPAAPKRWPAKGRSAWRSVACGLLSHRHLEA